MSEILTYSGIMFDPLHPDAAGVDIMDIAHALSLLCRANGHVKRFYSVCQHSINCAQEAAARGYSRRVQLGCLLHDASEAYLSDITRPVKQELPGYKEIEAPLQETIWNKWLESPLTSDERTQIFAVDDAMLAHEFLMLMGAAVVEPTPVLQSQPDFAFPGFGQCEQAFLRLFQDLTT